MLLINESWIKEELGGLYGERVVRDIANINRLYGIYDGVGQSWPRPANLGYDPNQTITNLTRKLIRDEARFMMSRAPEIRLIPEDAKDADACKTIEKWLIGVLNQSQWQRKLIQAARDCFIGKRVALKLTGGRGKPLRVDFRPSQEFVYDTVDDDSTRIRKIIFFYQVADTETDRAKQRIWRQRYELVDGRCILDEGLFDGYGNAVETIYEKFDTGLECIPCTVILNDGLTGDLEGESDVDLLISNQDTYNRLNSDDADALKFNMFPMRSLIDASEESAKNLTIAPGSLADISTDPTLRDGGGRQAKYEVVESGFGYDARLENRLNRTKNDMHMLLSVPNISLEMLKGIATSGKGMKAIYWELLCRCEEKWAEGWDGAIKWLVDTLIMMAQAYGVEPLPDIEYNVRIEHLYPIPDDEEEERANDLAEVASQARSRASYISKWQQDADAEGELNAIVHEQALLNDAFVEA